MHAQVAEQAKSDGRWTVHRYGIGDEDGDLELNVMKHTEFSSFLHPSADGLALFREGTSILRTERCPVRRLDALLPALVPDLERRRVHLKTDTQGYDLKVIRGLGSQLSRVRSLQIEAPIVSLYDADGFVSDTFALMRDAGLSLTGLFPVSRDKSLRIIELDCLFIRVGPD
jgi:FkbM family methyltransferase